MSIVKKHLVLHTFENIRAVHATRWADGWIINRVYPSVIPPSDVHRYARTFKMLAENTCHKGIVYVEWLIRKDEAQKRFKLFK